MAKDTSHANGDILPVVVPNLASKAEQATKVALWMQAVTVASVKTLVPITLDLVSNYS